MPPLKISAIVAREKEAERLLDKLSKVDMGMFFGAFSFLIIERFALKYNFTYKVFLLMIVMNYYDAFLRTDALTWGIVQKSENLEGKLRFLRTEGYIDKQVSTRGGYYLTLKGKKIVEEYRKEYTEYAKSVRRDIFAKFNPLKLGKAQARYKHKMKKKIIRYSEPVSAANPPMEGRGY